MRELWEQPITSELVYQGPIINVRRDEVELPDGRRSFREVVEHPGAVAILAITDDEQVLLVRQYRHATGEVLWEEPAGKLDMGEDPRVCANRELAEETGYRAQSLEPLVSFFTSPGFANELLHVFLATGLKKGVARPEADELLEPVLLPLEMLERMAVAGQVRDAKTLAALCLYRLRR